MSLFDSRSRLLSKLTGPFSCDWQPFGWRSPLPTPLDGMLLHDHNEREVGGPTVIASSSRKEVDEKVVGRGAINLTESTSTKIMEVEDPFYLPGWFPFTPLSIFVDQPIFNLVKLQGTCNVFSWSIYWEIGSKFYIILLIVLPRP